MIKKKIKYLFYKINFKYHFKKIKILRLYLILAYFNILNFIIIYILF